MSVSPVSSISSSSNSHLQQIDWNNFWRELRNDLRMGEFASSYQSFSHKPVKYFSIKETEMSSSIEVANFVHRKQFVEKIVEDICSSYPKSEHLVIISMGAERLFMEFLIGKALIENGFHDISFFFVDPKWELADDQTKNSIQSALEAFSTKISDVYWSSYQRNFQRDQVQYVSKASEVHLHLPANVALIECLPPYSKPLKSISE